MKHKHATLLTAIGQGMPVEFQDAGGWHVADSDDLEEFNPLSNPDWNWRVGAEEDKDKTIARLQAKIDALMLEHCPEKMTVSQQINWAKYQKGGE